MRRLLVLAATAALGVGAALGSTTHAAFADTGNTGSSGGSAGTPSASAIVATAEQYVGYPYAYIGDDPSTGFSCIGFVHYVFAQNGLYVPEDLSKAYASAPQVDQSNLQPGDLVFFQNTVWNGISHVDIYVGDGKMIGADTFQTGVQWDTLSDAYWQEHYLGATRPLSNPTGTPVDPSATPVPSGPSLTPPSSGPSLAIKAGTTLTAQHSIQVYSGPGNTYSGIDTVTPDISLTVVQTQGQWVNVSYNDGNQYGWVHGPDLNLAAAGVSTSGAGSDTGSAGTNGNGSTSSNTITTSSTITSTSSISGTAGKTLVVQARTLTVYSGPSTGGTVLMTLTAGTAVTVLHTQGQWQQVVLPDGTEGWVDGRALGVNDPGSGTTPQVSNTGGTQRASTSTARHTRRPRVRVQVVKGFHAAHTSRTTHTSSAKERSAVVTADVLFVRAGPSLHARILRRVHAGDRLHVLSTTHGWDYVSLRDNSRGWVYGHWVRVAKSAA